MSDDIPPAESKAPASDQSQEHTSDRQTMAADQYHDRPAESKAPVSDQSRAPASDRQTMTADQGQAHANDQYHDRPAEVKTLASDQNQAHANDQQTTTDTQHQPIEQSQGDRGLVQLSDVTPAPAPDVSPPPSLSGGTDFTPEVSDTASDTGGSIYMGTVYYDGVPYNQFADIDGTVYEFPVDQSAIGSTYSPNPLPEVPPTNTSQSSQSTPVPGSDSGEGRVELPETTIYGNVPGSASTDETNLTSTNPYYTDSQLGGMTDPRGASAIGYFPNKSDISSGGTQPNGGNAQQDKSPPISTPATDVSSSPPSVPRLPANIEDLRISLGFGNHEVQEGLRNALEAVNNNAAKDPATYLEVSNSIERLYVRYDYGATGYHYEIDRKLLQSQGYSDGAISTLDKIFQETRFAPQGVQRGDFLIVDAEGNAKLIRNVTEAESDRIQRTENYIHDQRIRQQAAEVLNGLLQGLAGIAQGKQALENLVPPRGGAASGKPKTYEPRIGPYKPDSPKLGGYGPQPLSNNSQENAPKVSTGEIKSELSKEAATRKALSDWAAGVSDGSYVAVAIYDAHGNIGLDIYLAGGNQDLVWHNANIGHIDPAYLPKSAYGTKPFGDSIEPYVTKYIGEYLGQFFQVKSASARGPDLVPRTPQMRFNLSRGESGH